MTTVTISKKRLDELLEKAGIQPMSLKDANKVVADNVAQIKVLLNGIKEVVEQTGIEVRLGGSYGLLSAAIEGVDELHRDWNTSSYDF